MRSGPGRKSRLRMPTTTTSPSDKLNAIANIRASLERSSSYSAERESFHHVNIGLRVRVLPDDASQDDQPPPGRCGTTIH